jgi:hypothetical protein
LVESWLRLAIKAVQIQAITDRARPIIPRTCSTNSTAWKACVLYQGIAARSFELADYVKVKGASLENGFLHVDLVREIPEAMKPCQTDQGRCLRL